MQDNFNIMMDENYLFVILVFSLQSRPVELPDSDKRSCATDVFSPGNVWAGYSAECPVPSPALAACQSPRCSHAGCITVGMANDNWSYFTSFTKKGLLHIKSCLSLALRYLGLSIQSVPPRRYTKLVFRYFQHLLTMFLSRVLTALVLATQISAIHCQTGVSVTIANGTIVGSHDGVNNVRINYGLLASNIFPVALFSWLSC